MQKLYKLSAFTLFIMSLAIVFGGIIFAFSYMKIPADTPVTAELAMGRIFFISRCFEVGILVMLTANLAIGYAILNKLESKNDN